MNPDKIQLTIYKLIAGELELSEFEQWVYSETELETILGQEEYLKLISVNYNIPSSLHEAEKILKKHINIGRYYEWVVRRILQKVIDKPPDAHQYIEQCYDMYCDGFNFLDNIGIGYGLEITAPPSSYNAENLKKMVESFYPAVAHEAEKVLSWLDNGTIVITGHSGEYQGIEYDDSRSTHEKKPTSYQVANSPETDH